MVVVGPLPLVVSLIVVAFCDVGRNDVRLVSGFQSEYRSGHVPRRHGTFRTFLFGRHIAQLTCPCLVYGVGTLVALGQIFQPSVLLVIVGLISTAVLLVKNIPGALLIGIAITTICGIPFGLTHFDGFVSTPPSVEPIFMKFEWHNIFTVDMVMVVFSFLFMDLFDTLGTLVSLLYKGGFVKDGKMPRMKESFFADAMGTTIGACIGTSAISTYVESAAGVSVGGKSGLTAFVIAVCFFLSLFFAPLFLSIPAQATAPVLILVGFLMISCIKEIDLDDYAEAIPAFICIITIPLTYSIANGIVFGLLSYVLINLISGKFKKIRIEMYLLSVFFIVMLLLH